MSLIQNKKYQSIDHKFLVIYAHNYYLLNDTDFSHIERQKTTATVNLPQDWIPYIEKAEHKNPFVVDMVQPLKVNIARR